MEYNDDNIFAKMLRKEIPCDAVYEDEHVLAFHDIAPAAPVHVLVIPKTKHTSFDDFSAQAGGELLAAFFQSVKKVVDVLGVAKSGYRIIMNHGADAFQTVAHFHIHILAGKKLGGLLPNDNLLR